jgi:hypothetical protein
MKTTSGCRIDCLCFYVCCYQLVGCQIGSNIWSPKWLSVSLCVVACRPAARMGTTLGCQIGCLFFVVVAVSWPVAKLEATWFAELAACVSRCCYLLVGDHNGNHIRSPNWLLLTSRRPSLNSRLVATLALCVRRGNEP